MAPLQEEILRLCNPYQDKLPTEFLEWLDELEAGLLAGVVPAEPRMRGSEAPFAIQLHQAAVTELRKLLCTDDKRYEEVRQEGRTLSRAAIAATAGYVAGALGISIGLATAAVGFLALVVLKVGIGVFCQLVPTAA